MSEGGQNNRDGMKNLPSVIDLIAYASFLFLLLLPTVVRETLVIPSLYMGCLWGCETWLWSHTASKWPGEDLNAGSLGPESILAELCLIKASKLILKQPALSFQPKPRGALDTQELESSSGRSFWIPSCREQEGLTWSLISQWTAVTKLGFSSDPWSHTNNW